MPHIKRFEEVTRRFLAGHNYRDIASKLGVHRSTIYEYANGNAPQDGNKIRRLAEVLELSPEETDELLVAGGYIKPRATLDAAFSQVREVAQRQELTWDPVLEEFDLAGARGLENVQPEDRPLLAEFVRWLASEDRKKQGRE